MQVHRLQSPFRHWLSGLFVELAVFGGFMALVGLMVALIVRIL